MQRKYSLCVRLTVKRRNDEHFRFRRCLLPVYQSNSDDADSLLFTVCTRVLQFHIHPSTNLGLFVYINLSILFSLYIYIYISINMYNIYIYTFLLSYYIYFYIYSFTHTHTHTHIYIYIYILKSVYLGSKLLFKQVL